MGITKKHLLEDFDLLKRHTDLNLVIEWSGEPPRPRIWRVTEFGDWAENWPRLSVGQMHLWMEAFDSGYGLGYEAKENEIGGAG